MTKALRAFSAGPQTDSPPPSVLLDSIHTLLKTCSEHETSNPELVLDQAARSAFLQQHLHSHPKCFNATLQLLTRAASSSRIFDDPLSISQLAVAQVRLKVMCPLFWQRLAGEHLHSVPQYPMEQIANLTWAAAKLDVPVLPPLAGALRAAALRVLPACNPRNVTTLLWAYATSASLRHPSDGAPPRDLACQQTDDWSTDDDVWGSADAAAAPPLDIPEALQRPSTTPSRWRGSLESSKVSPRQPGAVAEEAAGEAVPMCGLDELCDELVATAEGRAGDMVPRGLSTCLWAVVALGRPQDRAMAAGIAERALAALPELTARGTANVAWACARLEVRSTHMCVCCSRGLRTQQQQQSQSLFVSGRCAAALLFVCLVAVGWHFRRCSSSVQAWLDSTMVSLLSRAPRCGHVHARCTVRTRRTHALAGRRALGCAPAGVLSTCSWSRHSLFALAGSVMSCRGCREPQPWACMPLMRAVVQVPLSDAQAAALADRAVHYCMPYMHAEAAAAASDGTGDRSGPSGGDTGANAGRDSFSTLGFANAVWALGTLGIRRSCSFNNVAAAGEHISSDGGGDGSGGQDVHLEPVEEDATAAGHAGTKGGDVRAIDAACDGGSAVSPMQRDSAVVRNGQGAAAGLSSESAAPPGEMQPPAPDSVATPSHRDPVDTQEAATDLLGSTEAAGVPEEEAAHEHEMPLAPLLAAARCLLPEASVGELVSSCTGLSKLGVRFPRTPRPSALPCSHSLPPRASARLNCRPAALGRAKVETLRSVCAVQRCWAAAAMFECTNVAVAAHTVRIPQVLPAGGGQVL